MDLYENLTADDQLATPATIPGPGPEFAITSTGKPRVLGLHHFWTPKMDGL